MITVKEGNSWVKYSKLTIGDTFIYGGFLYLVTNRSTEYKMGENPTFFAVGLGYSQGTSDAAVGRLISFHENTKVLPVDLILEITK